MKGYILFHKYKRDVWCDEDGVVCKTKKEVLDKYHSHWDEKWDYSERHLIHYYYLDLSTMKFTPLEKWKYGYVYEMGYADEKTPPVLVKRFNATVMSKAIKESE